MRAQAVADGWQAHKRARTQRGSRAPPFFTKTPWDVSRALRWMSFIVRHPPQSLCDSAQALVHWLQREAAWHLMASALAGAFCLTVQGGGGFVWGQIRGEIFGFQFGIEILPMKFLCAIRGISCSLCIPSGGEASHV